MHVNVQHTLDEKNHHTRNEKDQKSEKKYTGFHSKLRDEHSYYPCNSDKSDLVAEYLRVIISKNLENVEKMRCDLNASVILQNTDPP